MKRWPTGTELKRLCETWQKLLRLSDWNIKIRYARSREMLDEESASIGWGRCTLNENHKRAEVLVLHPDDYMDDEGRMEIEQTVVHELLHVSLHGIAGHDDVVERVEEQHINLIAELLVFLYRGSDYSGVYS
jgi:hypothetical protein